MTKRLRLIIASVVALVLSMTTGCGGDDSVTKHNAKDVEFVDNMIPHHAQALAMAKDADAKATAPQVKDLSKRIESEQRPEIDKMNGWLVSWGEKPMDAGAAALDEHAAHAEGMKGMMSADGMDKLAAAKPGVEYDRMFLDMMIEHHKGAIDMARTEKLEGKFGEATQLAESIANAQAVEVTEMEDLLGQIR